MRFMPFVKGKKGFQMAGGGVSDSGGGGGGSYVLPVASANTLGGVKVGEGLSITPNGVLSSGGSGGGIDFSSTETKIGTFLGVDLYSKVYSTVGTDGANLLYKNADLSDKKIFYAFAISGISFNSQYFGYMKNGSALSTANASISFTFSSNVSSTTDVDIVVLYTKIS